MQRELGLLEDRAHADGELLAAIMALFQAVADALGRVRLDRRDVVHAAAVEAHRAVRPKRLFHPLEGGGFIVKVGLRENGHGGKSFADSTYHMAASLQDI